MDPFKWTFMWFPVICHTDVTNVSLRVTPITQAGVSICHQLYQSPSVWIVCWPVASHLSVYWLNFFLIFNETIQNQYSTVCVCRKQPICSYDKKCGDWFSIQHIPTFTNPGASVAPLNPWKHRFTCHNNRKTVLLSLPGLVQTLAKCGSSGVFLCVCMHVCLCVCKVGVLVCACSIAYCAHVLCVCVCV